MKKPLLVLMLLFFNVGCSLFAENWKLVKIVSKGAKTETVNEVIQVRYCTSSAEEKSVDCSAGTTNDLTVSGSIQGGGDIGIVFAEGKFSVGAEVASSLGFNRSSGETLALEPPPTSGLIYHYPIEKSYHIFTGEILGNSSYDNEDIFQYTFNASCSLKKGEPEITTCDGSSVENSSTPPSTIPTPSSSESRSDEQVQATNEPSPETPTHSIVPKEEAPAAVPEPATVQVSSKCDLIKQDFPQTLESVRNFFSLPGGERNFRLVYEGCGAIATGFIFEGDTEFELSVPDGGCIDSYSGAYFSEPPVEESFGGLRAYAGTVRTTGVTYRASGCELKS